MRRRREVAGRERHPGDLAWVDEDRPAEQVASKVNHPLLMRQTVKTFQALDPLVGREPVVVGFPDNHRAGPAVFGLGPRCEPTLLTDGAEEAGSNLAYVRRGQEVTKEQETLLRQPVPESVSLPEQTARLERVERHCRGAHCPVVGAGRQRRSQSAKRRSSFSG